MLSKHTTKSHSAKWAEAERELAIRRVIIPPLPVNHEHLVVQKDVYLPRVPDAPRK